MFQILNMGLLDIFWGVPFLCLSILAMTCFFDALSTIHNITQTIELHKGERDRLSDYLKSGNIVGASKIIDSSKDPLITSMASVLNACVQNRLKEYGALKSEIRGSLNGLLKVPHELIFNYFCDVILTIGFGGTLLSFFHLLADFDINTNDFSQLFRFLSVGLKSSFFGVVASILMSTGHVRLERIVEAKKEGFMNEDFHQNLIWIFNSSLTRPNGQIISAGKSGRKVMGKESCDLELQIKELEGAIK